MGPKSSMKKEKISTAVTPPPDFESAFMKAMHAYEKMAAEAKSKGSEAPSPPLSYWHGVDFETYSKAPYPSASTFVMRPATGSMPTVESLREDMERLTMELAEMRMMLRELNFAWQMAKDACPLCGEFKKHEDGCPIAEAVEEQYKSE